MNIKLNCDDLELWDKLNVHSIMQIVKQEHEQLVIEHCANNYNWTRQEVEEFWGLGSELLFETGARPAIMIDGWYVHFTI